MDTESHFRPKLKEILQKWSRDKGDKKIPNLQKKKRHNLVASILFSNVSDDITNRPFCWGNRKTSTYLYIIYRIRHGGVNFQGEFKLLSCFFKSVGNVKEEKRKKSLSRQMAKKKNSEAKTRMCFWFRAHYTINQVRTYFWRRRSVTPRLFWKAALRGACVAARRKYSRASAVFPFVAREIAVSVISTIMQSKQ